MIQKTNILLCLLFFVSSIGLTQESTYAYKSELKNVTDTWHEITLDDTVLEQISPSLNDLRIFGITAANDTIEAPYLLRINSEMIKHQNIAFKTINTVNSGNTYYYTFELTSEELINQISLDFTTQNFDWNVQLEGSQAQKEWFTILNDYRILSIKNDNTDYSFTKLRFPDTKYRYYRLTINSNKNPQLKATQIEKQKVTKGVSVNHEVKKFSISENKKKKITEIDLELKARTSVNEIALSIDNDFDYYRPLTITYVADSIATEKGWKFQYRTLKRTTLNSIEPNQFTFENTLAKKFKITITNRDNQPLQISDVTVAGNQYQLITRFTEAAKYVLAYGNKNARKPMYDIQKFTNTIPETVTALQLGKQQFIEVPAPDKPLPLFESKYWLWAVMFIVIILLGGFTLKMIKSSKLE